MLRQNAYDDLMRSDKRTLRRGIKRVCSVYISILLLSNLECVASLLGVAWLACWSSGLG